jgi:hypothetical protein
MTSVTMNDATKPPTIPPPLAREAGAGKTGIKLTAEQQRARRARSIAIAVALGVLVILFYVVTMVKGPAVLVRPL